MGKILVADDDININKLIEVFLKKQNYEIITAFDGKEALDIMDREKIDLLITDVMMPKIDGLELCRQIREFSDIPILMLTVKGEISDKVNGFECGADDYLTKPFELVELLMRVKVLLKRYHINDENIIKIGQVKLNKADFTVEIDNKQIILPLKEFQLLFKLAGRKGKTFTRDELIEDIWGYDFDGNERTLDVHIGRLRDKFNEKECRIRIRTIRGLGYKLEECNE